MEYIIGFLLALILINLIKEWWELRREAAAEHDEDSRINDNNNEQNTEAVMEIQKGARDLFLETLTKIGCQYDLTEDGDDIYFAYQGEHFLVNASNKRRAIYIYDIKWGQVELYDIEEVSRLRKAINKANLETTVTTLYTIDESENSMSVHCKTCILFVPQIPDIENYLSWVLSEFFDAHQCVGAEMARLREKEKSKA